MKTAAVNACLKKNVRQGSVRVQAPHILMLVLHVSDNSTYLRRNHRRPGDRLSTHCAGAVLGKPFGQDHPECQAVLCQGRGADCEG